MSSGFGSDTPAAVLAKPIGIGFFGTRGPRGGYRATVARYEVAVAASNGYSADKRAERAIKRLGVRGRRLVLTRVSRAKVGDEDFAKALDQAAYRGNLIPTTDDPNFIITVDVR